MNLVKINTILIIVTLITSATASAQIVSFDYDKSGNRILRDIIYLQPQETVDSSSNKQTIKHHSLLGNTNIIVSPNPNGGKFKITLEGYEPEIGTEITLHSLRGILVYQNKNVEAKTEVDISARQNGIYILTLIIGDKKKTWKVVKQ